MSCLGDGRWWSACRSKRNVPLRLRSGQALGFARDNSVRWFTERFTPYARILVRMSPTSRPPTLRSILQQRCPRCRLGQIFRHSIFSIYLLRLPKMYDCCPACDLKFEREPGYFLGAMYISYAMGLGTVALFAGLLWAVTGWWITKDFIWACVLFLPLAPAIALFARVLWMYLDWKFDPGPEK